MVSLERRHVRGGGAGTEIQYVPRAELAEGSRPGVPRTAALWSVCSCLSCGGWRLRMPGSSGHPGTGVLHAGTWPQFTGKLRALAWELLVPLPHWAQGDLPWFSWLVIVPPSPLAEGPTFPSAPALAAGRAPSRGTPLSAPRALCALPERAQPVRGAGACWVSYGYGEGGWLLLPYPVAAPAARATCLMATAQGSSGHHTARPRLGLGRAPPAAP